MTKISYLPVLLPSKAILSPPGDQRGVPEYAPKKVSCAGPDPSAFEIQTSLLPELNGSVPSREGQFCAVRGHGRIAVRTLAGRRGRDADLLA